MDPRRRWERQSHFPRRDRGPRELARGVSSTGGYEGWYHLGSPCCPRRDGEAQRIAALLGIRVGEASHPGPILPVASDSSSDDGGSSHPREVSPRYFVEAMGAPSLESGTSGLEEGWTTGYWAWVASILREGVRSAHPLIAYIRVIRARQTYRQRWSDRSERRPTGVRFLPGRAARWARHQRADLCLLLWLLENYPSPTVTTGEGLAYVGVPPLVHRVRERLSTRDRLLRLVEQALREVQQPIWLRLLSRATDTDALFEEALRLWLEVRAGGFTRGRRFSPSMLRSELGDRRAEVATAAYSIIPADMLEDRFVDEQTGEDRTGLLLQTCPSYDIAFDIWEAEFSPSIWSDPFVTTASEVMLRFLEQRDGFERDFYTYCRWGAPPRRHSRADASRFLDILREPCWGLLPSSGWVRHRTHPTRLWDLYVAARAEIPPPRLGRTSPAGGIGRQQLECVPAPLQQSGSPRAHHWMASATARKNSYGVGQGPDGGRHRT